MSEVRKRLILFAIIAFCILPFISSPVFAQDRNRDEQTIQRYKQILQSKPREGSTFDRLYQFYLEGPGLDQMIADYQAAAEARPDDPNVQLILGHINKRLGKDQETIDAYKRAVELAPKDYYPHYALGKIYAMLRRHEEAIAELKQAADLSAETRAASPEELSAIYKELGRAYFSRDRLDEAIAAWQRIAELDPQNVFARIELADILLEQKLYPQAIAQHEAIIKLKRDDPYRVCLSMREIGKIQAETGDYDAAVKSYDAALALTAPGNWLRKDLQQRIISIYAHNNDWPGLIAYYQAKLEETPNDVEMIGLLADAYIENEQIDEGFAHYRKGLELAPTSTALRLKLIASLRNARQFAEAAAEYESLIKQQPDEMGIYRELGELYIKLEQPDQARAVYKRMLDRKPDDAGIHLILAEIYAGHEWIDDAIAEYETAIKLAPGNLDLIDYFGEFYFRQGNRDKTIETWNRLVEGDRANAVNYDRLAQLLDGKEFKTEAIAASRKSVEHAPDEYRYREQLAKRLTESKEYDEALSEYEQAAKLAPNEFFAEKMSDQMIEIYRRQGTLAEKIDALAAQPESFEQQKQLARMCLKMGNVTYAVEALDRAKELNSDDALVHRWLAEIHERQGQRDEAIAVYNHLIEIDSGNAREYYTSIARIYINMTNFDAATEAAKQVIAHSPRNPEGHQLLAEIAKQKGDLAEAIDSLKNAIRLRPESTDIRSGLADVYRQQGDYRQAIEQYWRCWELSDNLGGKLAFVELLSTAYYDMGRSGELEEKLWQMAKTNPSDIGPALALAELNRMQGDLPAAREQLARALEREPENPDLLSQLVKVCSDLGDAQDALNYQQRLAKVQPEAQNQQRLGELLFDMGREQEAIQTWTKLLYAKNKSIDAEVKLARLLIRHGLLDEALSALDRAGEMATDAMLIYQIGAAFVEMNELDRAVPHFQRVLEMPEPPATAAQTSTVQISYYYGPPGYDEIRRFTLPQSLARQIQQPYRTGQAWSPSSFEEAQAAALVQLATIAQQQQRLEDWINQYELKAKASPKDLQTLETLAQIYIVTENTDKMNETVERLIALSPDDPTYHTLQFNVSMQRGYNYEVAKKFLSNMQKIAPEARLWYLSQYAAVLHRQGKKAEAAELLPEIENAKVKDVEMAYLVVSALTQMGRIDSAEKILAKTPEPPKQPAGSGATGASSYSSRLWSYYTYMYRSLAEAYLSEGHVDRGLELFWSVLERTKPDVTNARRVAPLAYSSTSYSGYRPLQTSFPSANTYYDDSRVRLLQDFFGLLWTQNQLEPLYAKLQAETDAATGGDRVYPGLALSYCYWWEGQRKKSQEVLAMLQSENPSDLIIKLNTIYVSIQTGDHQTAMALLTDLTDKDPRNRMQYNELILQLAIHTGDTVKVREITTRVLNSPTSAQALRQYAEKLREGGLTQYAISVAKKAMTLSMGQRDPNFLMQLSQQLGQLGRGQDAAILVERAMRFANQRDRYGRPMSSYYYEQAANLMRASKVAKERESQLLAVAEKNPKSFRAQLDLASYYEGANKVNEAASTYDKILELRPSDSTTRLRYAQMLKRAGRNADAVEQYTKLLRDNPNALGYDYWEVMETFLDAGKLDEIVSLAKDMISSSIGRNYGNDLARNVASRCLDQNRPEAAAGIYEKLIEVQPSSSYLYTQLASAYAAAGDREKAIQFLREKLDSDDPMITENPSVQAQMVMKLVDLYKASGDAGILMAEYESRLAEKPDDATLVYAVASIKLATGDEEGADLLVDQLINDDSVTQTDWFSALSVAYRNAGDQEREILLLEHSIKKSSSYNSYQLMQTYELLGAAYARRGDKEKAADLLRKMGHLRLVRYGGGGSYYEKQRVADTFMQYEMWDDAEAMYMEIVNDLGATQYYQRQAQERMMEIKQRRDGLGKTTRVTEKTQSMFVGMQRALAQQYAQRNDLENAAKLYKQIAEAVPEDLGSRAELAQIYSRQKKHDEAIAQWEALLEADPENTQYQDGLVSAYQSAGKIEEALELAEKYIEEEPSSVDYARIAKIYASGNRTDEAIEAYNKANELSPGNSRVYQELARLYLQKEDLAAAEEAYQEALKYTGQDYERRNIERQMMDLYRRQGKLEEMMQRAEEAGTLTYEMQRERARNFRNEGKLQAAVDAYKKAMEMTSQSYERENVANDLIQVYVQLGENELALEIYRTLSQSSSSGMSITFSSSGFTVRFAGDRARETIIKAYQSQGKLDELLAHFQKRREEKPDDQAALEAIAEIHRTNKDHEKAAESYQVLCKAQPGNVRSYYYAAAALNQQDQPELAEEMLNQGNVALSSSNRSDDMWFLGALGSICLEGEMYEPALKLFENAISESGRYGGSGMERETLYNTLGQCYLAAGRYEEAINAYQQVANFAGSDSTRREAEAAIRKAYKDGGLYGKLIEQRQQAVRDDPTDPDTHYALAQVYEENNMNDEAITAYERAAELNPKSTQILEPLAKLYADSDPEKAKTTHKRLIELVDNPGERIRQRRNLVSLYKQLGETDAAMSELHNTAVSAPEQIEKDAALRDLWGWYMDNKKESEGLIALEELTAQMTESAMVYELMGNAYKAAGEQEKAEAMYTKWAELRQIEVESSGRAYDYRNFVDQLLDREIMPEKALVLAQRAAQMDSNYNYILTLGRAYLVNEQYEKAAEELKRALITSSVNYRQIWDSITKTGKTVKDEARFVQLIIDLAEATSANPNANLNANIAISRFYSERGQNERAQEYLKKTGFVAEDKWLIVGAFDNTGGIGYNKSYIQENATKIDTAAEYAGKDGKVRWEKRQDKAFDGYVDLNQIFGDNQDWVTAYAWTTVTSAAEKKFELRIGNDDQIKIWLNGEEVFAYGQARSASIDQNSIPVTLKAGENSLLVKSCDEGVDWGFYLRLVGID